MKYYLNMCLKDSLNEWIEKNAIWDYILDAYYIENNCVYKKALYTFEDCISQMPNIYFYDTFPSIYVYRSVFTCLYGMKSIGRFHRYYEFYKNL